MIPEAGYFFSIAGLSASFAGLAGLVMALRRGGEMRPIDTFRLRQMVEFSFANIVIVISVPPLAQLLGSGPEAGRWVSAAIALYVVLTNVLFARRTRRASLQWRGWWVVIGLGVSLVTVILAAVVIWSGSFGLFMVLMVLVLVRPMLPFLLVLESWENEVRRA